jgi:ribose transport system substrate-binding protein
MTTLQRSRSARIGTMLLAAGLALTACASDSGQPEGKSAEADTVVLKAADLQPQSIVGKGQHGETPALIDVLQLTDAEKDKVRSGHFRVGIAMVTASLDYATLQVKGMTDTLEDLGMEVIGVTDAKFDVHTQISDIENLITQKPDLIISIPADDVATATAYRKVGAAGIKLIFIANVPQGLTYPADYQSAVSADDQGNGEIAASALSAYIPKGGVAGIVDYGVDFFTTNQRSLRVKTWFKENRPDVKVKEVMFTDTNAVGPVAANFVTANPDVNGLFVSWDAPAMQSVAALRNSGVTMPVVTIDFGKEAAVEMASGGYIKAIGAQDPYEQGVAEALAGANVLIGKTVPAWVSLPSIAVTPENVLASYKGLFHADPPKELTDACKTSGLCG